MFRHGHRLALRPHTMGLLPTPTTYTSHTTPLIYTSAIYNHSINFRPNYHPNCFNPSLTAEWDRLIRSHHHAHALTTQTKTGNLFSSAKHALSILDSTFQPAFNSPHLTTFLCATNRKHINNQIGTLIEHYHFTMDKAISKIVSSSASIPLQISYQHLSKAIRDISRHTKISSASIDFAHRFLSQIYPNDPNPSRCSFSSRTSLNNFALRREISYQSSAPKARFLLPTPVTTHSSIRRQSFSFADAVRRKPVTTFPKNKTLHSQPPVASALVPPPTTHSLAAKPMPTGTPTPIVTNCIPPPTVSTQPRASPSPSTPPPQTSATKKSTPTALNASTSTAPTQIHATPTTTLLRNNTPSPPASNVSKSQTTTNPTVETPNCDHQTQSPKNTQQQSTLSPSTSSSSKTRPYTFRQNTSNITRFIRHNRATTHWTIPPLEKDTIIIGDSNLSHLKNVPDSFQVLSYSGANFDHIRTLLANYPNSYPQPKRIIFSVGINNRNQNPAASSIPTLRKMILKAHSIFPDTHLYFVTINFSNSLPTNAKKTIKSINSQLFSIPNCSIIPPLPLSLFSTVSDNIHWTSETASVLLNHWNTSLNSLGPQADKVS